MAKKENKEIKKAMEIIDEMSMNPKEWELYESRRLAIMDYNTSIYQSKKEEKMEIAKKLLERNMSVEEIAEITGLSKEEIQKL